MTLIDQINACEVLDSRGNPTLLVRVITTNGRVGYACCLLYTSPSPRD